MGSPPLPVRSAAVGALGCADWAPCHLRRHPRLEVGSERGVSLQPSNLENALLRVDCPRSSVSRKWTTPAASVSSAVACAPGSSSRPLGYVGDTPCPMGGGGEGSTAT